MKIHIEIDITPAELRRFLGLPDVAGLQEDMIEYIRGRVVRGAENFDPVELLRESTTLGNRTVQWLLNMAATRLSPEQAGQRQQTEKPGEPAKERTGKSTGTTRGKTGKTTRRKRQS